MKISCLVIFLKFLAIHGSDLNVSQPLGSKFCDFGACSQKCDVVSGEVNCSCVDGFTLTTDSKTCALNDPTWKFVIGGWDSIKLCNASVATGAGGTLKIPTKNPTPFVATDVRNNILFWIESDPENLNKKGIYMTSLGEEHKTDVVLDSGLLAPVGIAFDWITGNVYFSDADLRCIAICALNPTKCVVIFQGGYDSEPTDLALVPNKRIMFWNDWNKKSIWSAGMDGRDPTEIIFTGYNITALTVDEVSSRIYWVRNWGEQIVTSKFDGSDRHVLITATAQGIFDINILGDWLFWSDWKTGTIKTANKLTGENDDTTVLKIDKQGYDYGVHVLHITKQPKLGESPCILLNCSHVCASSVFSGAVCLCPEGMISSGKSCQNDKNQQKLLLAQGNKLLVMWPTTFGPDVFKPITLPSQIKLITAVVYSPINKSLIIADGEERKIVEYNTKSKEYKVLIDSDLVNVTALDIDVKSEVLIWYDDGKATMEEYSFKTQNKTVILRGAGPKDFLKFSPNLWKFYGYTQISQIFNEGSQFAQIKNKIFQVDPKTNDIKVFINGNRLQRIIKTNLSAGLSSPGGVMPNRLVLATIGGAYAVGDIEKKSEDQHCSQRNPNGNKCTVCFKGSPCVSWCSVGYHYIDFRCSSASRPVPVSAFIVRNYFTMIWGCLVLWSCLLG